MFFAADKVLISPTVFWQNSLNNRWFKSVLLRWNISSYPSHTWLDKCPPRLTVGALSSRPIPIWKSSYQACQLFFETWWNVLPEVGFFSFVWEIGAMRILKKINKYKQLTQPVHEDLTHRDSSPKPLLVVWRLILPGPVESLGIISRLNSCCENWACKIFKQAFSTPGLHPPVGSGDFVISLTY